MWANMPQAPSIRYTPAHRAEAYHLVLSRGSMYFLGNKYKHSQQIMVLNICFSVSKTLPSILVMPERERFFFFCEFRKNLVDSSLLSNPLSMCFITDLKSLVGTFYYGTGRASLPTYGLLCPSTLPATFLMVPWRLKFFWMSTGLDINMKLKILTLS